MIFRFERIFFFAILSASLVASARGETSTNRIRFNRDIRPILSENCSACHGPDKNKRKAKLRLDIREVALEREAFVPGKPDESELIRRIFTKDEEDLMPPPESHKKLTAKQKQLLKQWIAEGAEYEPHWAYITPQRPPIPQIANRKSQIANPIDAFILHMLASKKIKPSPEADKRTLLRRLSLDLIGLPPTPAEVDAFLKDTRPDAYEREVDRLLSSPHFGERMAVTWLDVARYADTVGYHGDQNQNIFPYRDYVIDSFNRNKPFDQFTIEQLAGDLLPNPTVEQQVATGFNRLNMMTREGGAQPKEYIAKYQADRVRTVAGAWLGSTMGCCECHDHKYDPFTTKDFYQMEAFFADIKQWGYYADASYAPNPDLKGFGNDHPFPPEIQVESPYLHHRIDELQRRIDEVEASAAAKLKTDAKQKKSFDEWCKSSRAVLKQWPTGWAMPKPEVALKLKDTNAIPTTNFTVNADATISFSDKEKENTKITLPLSNIWISAIRLEIVPREVKEEKRTARKKRNGTAITLSASLKPKDDGKETKLAFFHAQADHKEDRYSMTLPIIGVKDLWQISTDYELQTAVWLLDKPLKASDGDALVVNIGNAAVGSARVSVSPFAIFGLSLPARNERGESRREGQSKKSASSPRPSPPFHGREGEDFATLHQQWDIGESLKKVLTKPLLFRSRADRAFLQKTYLLSTAWNEDALAEVKKIQKEVWECRNGRAFTMVTQAREPMTIRVLPRGNWQDESGEIVQPAPPHFLPQPKATGTNRLTRLDLARWLVSPDNPLTARAVMNRTWKQFFGTGISLVVDDLGAQGESPVHPELLDWLAVEFRESGWDVKHMVKLIVLSATYRQDSNQRPELKDIDPNNRLLACQSPRRLEAEFVRDNALFIAGLLNEDLGGPSVYPYQPPGYYANLQFPDRDYYPDKDERQYRRGIYTHWQRTFLQPMLANFDAPQREECVCARVVSSTPQQALTLLNDPTFVEASRVFAAKLLAVENKSDEQRIDLAFEKALARDAKPKEKTSLLKFLDAQREYYGSNNEDSKKLLKVGLAPLPKNSESPELAAWSQVCRVVLNLHETITRY